MTTPSQRTPKAAQIGEDTFHDNESFNKDIEEEWEKHAARLQDSETARTHRDEHETWRIMRTQYEAELAVVMAHTNHGVWVRDNAAAEILAFAGAKRRNPLTPKQLERGASVLVSMANAIAEENDEPPSKKTKTMPSHRWGFIGPDEDDQIADDQTTDEHDESGAADGATA